MNALNETEKCRLCGNVSSFLQGGELLDIHIAYFECAICGYVQTETPYWLGRAYEEAINDSDTGIISRNQTNARMVLGTMYLLGKLEGTMVDCAGGYGILVRMSRDYGINALWSDRFCKNLLARGFEYTTEKADIVTAFEAFEHFENPAEELDRMLEIAPNILFSTELIAEPSPKQNDWWYYGKEHGQHIGFFKIRTLEKLAKERGKFLLSNGVSYHLLTDQPVNRTLWKTMIRANRLVPMLLRSHLKSKTWQDHLFMAARRK